MFSVLFQIFSAYLLIDFVSGLFHFVEDNYFTPDTPIVGQTIYDNRVHHEKPRNIVAQSFWETNSFLYTIITPWFVALFYCCGILFTPFAISYIAIGMHTNQIHKYSHMTKSELPKWVFVMQRLFIFQNSHNSHHQDHTGNYCIVGNILNPILEWLGFWNKFIFIISLCGGGNSTRDLDIKPYMLLHNKST